MLCISCGVEMRLVQVQPDDTMMVTGYEHQTFECPSCQEIERRLTFTREPTPQPGQPAPIDQTAPVDQAAPVPPASTSGDTAPPVSPDSAPQEDEAAPLASADSKDQDQPVPPAAPTPDQNAIASPSRWARAVAKLRGMQARSS
jgi:hypothetical protein